jgi:enoyl-CoA hydratase/3-hydroxyacyl-CoA dehydrogenase
VAYSDGARSLARLGVVGSGQIGPDIALHMTKALHEHSVEVIVVDVSEAALAAGRQKLDSKVDKGAETGAFSPEQARAMKAGVRFTADYAALEGASLVIEAASEDLALKRRIFAELERRAAPDAVLASNSSHLEPERIFASLGDPARALVVHYFFPAERNPLVELVPSAATSETLVDWLLRFYERIGKVPLRIGSRYGYAIDPIFEGLFQAAALCVEDGLGSVREVDHVARRALGLGVGPFTAMNLTGGNPITAHGLEELHERVHPWFQTPRLLREAMRAGTAWDVPGRGETLELPPDREAAIRRRMQGAFFGLVGEVLDGGIASLSDLELGVELGLAMCAPFALMNQLGPALALERVRDLHRAWPDFFVPRCLVEQAERGEPWSVPCVLRRDAGRVAILTIRRPQVLNAMNAQVQSQLGDHLEAIEVDTSVDAVVVTGFGRKAFVSGADVGMLARIDSPEAGAATSRASHALMNRIEAFPKPVVCAYNGLAFGGGNELGLACHARLAPKGLAVLAAQPEPSLGIIPGAGATQRLPRLVGVERAAELLRSGRAISSAEAVEIGLIRAEVEGDLLEAAAALARDAASGAVPLPRLPRDPLPAPRELPQVDIGHRSRAVDALLQKTILEGLGLPLGEALELEVRRFGEVCGLADMRIGVRNFIEKGPRSKAPFVHR